MAGRDSWEHVKSFRARINSSHVDLELVAKGIKDLLLNNHWRDFTDPTGERHVYDEHAFAEFIQTKPEGGLGNKKEMIEKLLKDDADALRLFEDATTGEPGGDKKSANRIISTIGTNDRPIRGNTKAAGLRRLDRQAPELYEQVVGGELSVNAACIKAGFRKPMFSIPADVDGAVRAIRRRFTAAQVREIKEAL